MLYWLQMGSTASTASTYLPLALQVLIAVGLVAFLMVATHLLGATLLWIAAWRIRLVFITTSTNHRKLKAGGHP